MKNMKKTVVCATLLLAFACAGVALHGTALAGQQTICPVMGGAINKEIYADHNGKRVYFCCGGCIATFQKDPAKYIDKMEREGVELETVKSAGAKTGK